MFIIPGLVLFLLNCIKVQSAYTKDCNEGFTRVFKPSEPKKHYLLADCHRVAAIKSCVVNKLTENVHPELDFVNFDVFANTYVKCVADDLKYNQDFRINENLKWIDLYGKHEELQTPVHKGMHVKASVSKLKYFPLERNLQAKPEILLTKWLHNNQSDQEISAKISEEVEKTIVKSFSVMHGVETSVEMEWEAVVSGSVKAEYSFEKEKEEAITTKKKFKLEDTITVPASSSVKVLWLLTQANIKQQWTADIRISGWIAFKFESNNEIWFLPVGEMGYYYSEFFTKIDSYTLEFKAKGTESAPETVDSQVSTWQFGIQKDLPCAQVQQ